MEKIDQLIGELRDLLADLSAKDRLAVFQKLWAGHCKECGKKESDASCICHFYAHDRGNPYACKNDRKNSTITVLSKNR